MKRSKKIFLSSTVALLLCLGAGFWVRKKYSQQSEQATQTVVRKDIVHHIFLSGRVRPEASVAVTAPMGGRITALHVKEGAVVKTGDLLATLRLEAAGQQEILQKQAEVERLQSEVQSLENQLKDKNSVKELLASSQLQKDEDDLRSKRLDLASSQQNLKLLEQEIGQQPRQKNRSQQDIFVRSPGPGTITLISKSIGDYVGLSSSNISSDRTIMSLSNLTSLTVRTRLMEADLRFVNRDQEAIVRLDAFPDKEYAAMVNHIGGQGRSDEKAGYTFFDLDVLIKNADSLLRPEMNATVELLFGKKEKALTLPVNAVLITKEKSVVHIADTKEKKGFREQVVGIGIVTEEDIELTSGVAENDQVLEIDFSKVELGNDDNASRARKKKL